MSWFATSCGAGGWASCFLISATICQSQLNVNLTE
jgi:hypothetical protein